jgi:hypothetical protein
MNRSIAVVKIKIIVKKKLQANARGDKLILFKHFILSLNI